MNKATTLNGFLCILFCLVIALSERLVISFGTGGRGIIPLVPIAFPFIFLIAQRKVWGENLINLFKDKLILASLALIASLTFLPLFGILINSYPPRVVFDSYLKLSYIAYIIFGVYVFRPYVWNIFQKSVITTGVIVAIYSVFQFVDQSIYSFSGNPILSQLRAWDLQSQQIYSDQYILIGRSLGTFVNPNSLGIFSILYISMVRTFDAKYIKIGVISAVVMAVMSQSRGSLSALLSIFGIILVFKVYSLIEGRSKIKPLQIIIISIAALPLYALTNQLWSMMSAIASRYAGLANVAQEGIEGDQNLLGRFDVWVAAIDYLATNPLGTLGPPMLITGLSADNQFVFYALQGSIWLLILLVIFLWTLITRKQSVNYASTCLGIGILVNSITALPLDTSCSPIIWTTVGIIVAQKLGRKI